MLRCVSRCTQLHVFAKNAETKKMNIVCSLKTVTPAAICWSSTIFERLDSGSVWTPAAKVVAHESCKVAFAWFLLSQLMTIVHSSSKTKAHFKCLERAPKKGSDMLPVSDSRIELQNCKDRPFRGKHGQTHKIVEFLICSVIFDFLAFWAQNV